MAPNTWTCSTLLLCLLVGLPGYATSQQAGVTAIKLFTTGFPTGCPGRDWQQGPAPILELQVFNTSGANVALGAAASADSSIDTTGSCLSECPVHTKAVINAQAAKAVDGTVTTGWQGQGQVGGCNSCPCSANPWLLITLPSAATVSSVVIIAGMSGQGSTLTDMQNLADTINLKLAGFTLALLNSGGTALQSLTLTAAAGFIVGSTAEWSFTLGPASPSATPAAASTSSFVLTDWETWAPIAVNRNGEQFCWLNAAGSPFCNPNPCGGTVPTATSGNPFTSIQSGIGDGCHTFARRGDGTVSGWGYDGEGRISGISTTTNYKFVALGGHCTYAIDQNSAMTVAGYDAWGQCVAQSGTWSYVAAQYVSACGVTLSGLTTCWGESHGSPASNAVFITSGDKTMCSIAVDGTTTCGGWNTLSNPTAKLRYVSIDGNDPPGACGIATDWTILCWGAAASYTVPTGSFVYISNGGTTTYCAVKFDQSVVCFGTASAEVIAAAAAVGTVPLPARILAITGGSPISTPATSPTATSHTPSRHTQSKSPTRSVTPPKTHTRSESPPVTHTRLSTRTRTPTDSRPAMHTRTATHTIVASRSAARTPTHTQSSVPSRTRTQTPAPSTTPFHCVGDYHHPPGSKSCYRAEGINSFNWAGSSTQCTNGGKLATFTTTEDRDYVISSFCGVNVTQTTMWIGLRDLQGATGYASPAKHKWAWVGSSTPLTSTELAVFDNYWGTGGAAANPDQRHSCVSVNRVGGGTPHLQATECTTVLGPTRCCEIKAIGL